MKRKLGALAMALLFALTLIPTSVFAEVTTINLNGSACGVTESGEYTVGRYDGVNTLTVNAAGNTTLTLSGVKITAAGTGESAISILQGNVTLVLVGESTLTGGKGGAGIYVAEGASLTITGSGSLTAIGNAGVDSSDSGAAGIGGTGANGNSGAITIDGATVVAKGYGVHGSGIGSGSGQVKGEIKILNGANVTAQGGYYAGGADSGANAADTGKDDPEGSAAIGGGGKTGSTVAPITISNSTVTAYGGSKAAGIGANFWCSCTVIIEDSTVTAQGGSSSAAIGTGRAGDNGVTADITITNSVINATGGDYGAGIGTGCNNSSIGNGSDDLNDALLTKIKISGGTVVATGGSGGAGIGGGYKGNNLDIDIVGEACVTASAGPLMKGKTIEGGGLASAIGSGSNGSGTFVGSNIEIGEKAQVTVYSLSIPEGVPTKHAKPAVEVERLGSGTNDTEDVTVYLAPSDDTVAMVGQTGYTALADALEAGMGQTIVLFKDAALTADVTVDQNTTLLLGGNTLTCGSYRFVVDGATLTCDANTLSVEDTEGTELSSGGGAGAYVWSEPVAPAAPVYGGPAMNWVKCNADGNGVVKSGPLAASEGATITLYPKAAAGYVLDTVEVLDAEGNAIQLNGLKFRVPLGGVTVNATFKPAD